MWTFGLEVSGCYPSLVLLYNHCFSVLALQMNQLGTFYKCRCIGSTPDPLSENFCVFKKLQMGFWDWLQRDIFLSRLGLSELWKLHRTLSRVWHYTLVTVRVIKLHSVSFLKTKKNGTHRWFLLSELSINYGTSLSGICNCIYFCWKWDLNGIDTSLHGASGTWL